jgi:2-aminoethylphosphonate-pyruvate transaminase
LSPNAKRYILLNPGPVLTSEAVKAALAGVDLCHRDSDHTALLQRLQQKLLRVFGASGQEYSVLLLTGSGTSAVEASIATGIPPGRKLLVVSNGAFGERLQEIAAIHGVAGKPLRYRWAEPIRPADVEARLAREPDLFAVAMVHHETSVGVLNPVGALGEVAARHGRLFLVDCISSLGGEEIDVVRDHVDVCIACANKCLHGISGISFVCVNRRVWDRIRDVPERTYYLDLRRYRYYQEELGQTPFTPSVAAFAALDQALTELLDVGVPDRLRRYRELNALMRGGLERLGLEITNNHGTGSQTVTCVRVPDFILFDDLYEDLKAQGFIIYNCKNDLQDRVFQVANMGELSAAVVRDFLEGLAIVLDRYRPKAEVSHG